MPGTGLASISWQQNQSISNQLDGPGHEYQPRPTPTRWRRWREHKGPGPSGPLHTRVQTHPHIPTRRSSSGCRRRMCPGRHTCVCEPHTQTRQQQGPHPVRLRNPAVGEGPCPASPRPLCAATRPVHGLAGPGPGLTEEETETPGGPCLRPCPGLPPPPAPAPLKGAKRGNRGGLPRLGPLLQNRALVTWQSGQAVASGCRGSRQAVGRAQPSHPGEP